MRRYVHEVVVPTSPDQLFRTLSDFAGWPRWDPELAAIEAPRSLEAGARFSLTPKGGPRVSMTLEEVAAPNRLVDVAHLPLAKMVTTHQFSNEAGGTRIRVSLEIRGPLGFLWDRLIVRKQAAGLASQTAAFVRHAERS